VGRASPPAQWKYRRYENRYSLTFQPMAPNNIAMRKKTLNLDRKQFLFEDYSRGFVNYCGLKAMHADWGEFDSIVEIRGEHRQQDGFIHAGLMATMADHTAGYSAFTIVSERFQILTIEFKINFLRPAFGDALVCKSRVIREGRQVIVAESDVYDRRGETKVQTAKAIVTLMAVPKEKLLKEDDDKRNK
jgi:uncharacterized protein (TIGR00369 family)